MLAVGLDPTFDGDGKTSTSFGVSAVGTAVAQMRDGKLVVAGYLGDGPNAFPVARYNEDGSIDTTFGVGGKRSSTRLQSATVLMPSSRRTMAAFMSRGIRASSSLFGSSIGSGT